MTQKNFEPYDPAALPDRYSIQAKGHERFLVCGESPNISVRIERGMSVSAPAALKAPSGTIYLDGAAQGGPFHNNQAIDAMSYSPAHFGEVVVVEEPARAGIGDNQLAIVCRSDRGICELEPHLRRLHGKSLGVIILQKNPNTYTLRQVNPFLPATLEKAYERLNLMDPSAGNRRSTNRCLLLHWACVILVLLFPRISLDPVEGLPKLLQQWVRIF